jgi:hypothetical protein
MARFRSLPMSRYAVLAGRTLADVRNVVCLTIVIGVGSAVGFRFHSRLVGGGRRYRPALQVRLLVDLRLLRPDGFLRRVRPGHRLHRDLRDHVPPSAFVPVDTMPSWLQPIAR